MNDEQIVSAKTTPELERWLSMLERDRHGEPESVIYTMGLIETELDIRADNGRSWGLVS